jgi:hypothetical protein
VGEPVNQDQIDWLMQQFSNEYNKNMPRQIDDETILTSTSYHNSTIRFIYQKLQAARSMDVAAFQNRMTQNIRNEFCSTPVSRNISIMGVTATYIYYDSNWKYLTNVDVLPAHCGY